MGCSESRLSSTRSGTVRPRFLSAMARLALPAPVPPLALLRRKQRIARLLDRRGEDVLAADVDALAGHGAELPVEARRIAPGQLLHAADAQDLEVPQHGRSY